MYLVLIVNHIDKLAILEDVVFELDELLALPHHALLIHPLDLEGGGVYRKALIGQVGIQKSSKDHNLVLIHCEGTELAALSVATWPLKEDQFPMSSSVEVM